MVLNMAEAPLPLARANVPRRRRPVKGAGPSLCKQTGGRGAAATPGGNNAPELVRAKSRARVK
jgi:hypothetical protein